MAGAASSLSSSATARPRSGPPRRSATLAIGVASDEVARDGRNNPLKYEHLQAAGADMIVPDYRNLDELLREAGI